MIDPQQRFVVSYLDEQHGFAPDVIHPHWMRRHTQISTATQGVAGVRITRARAGHRPMPGLPLHNDVDLLLRYMLRGSMTLRFSDYGEHVVAAGSAWLQPRDVTHAVLDYSDDAEYLELAMPGDFALVDLPGSASSAEGGDAHSASVVRAPGLMAGVPQQFVMTHLRGDADFVPGRRVNSLSRDLGVSAATRGMVTARIGRRHPPVPAVPERRHYHNTQLQIVYLTRGWIRTEFEGQGEVQFWPGSCWTQPPKIEHAMRAYSPESFELFEVIIPSDFGIIEVDDPVADRLSGS